MKKRSMAILLSLLVACAAAQPTLAAEDATTDGFSEKHFLGFEEWTGEEEPLSGDVTEAEEPLVGEGETPVYRLYDPKTGEHLYTVDANERQTLVRTKNSKWYWYYEGTGWMAPTTSKTPVYRVYNPNSRLHHYTMSQEEADHLTSLGWSNEGACWYSDDAQANPIYRVYNPNSGLHHYTASKEEYDYLVSVGWNGEGIGWYCSGEGSALSMENDGSDYSLEANVTMTGSGLGYVAKMSLLGGNAGQAFDMVSIKQRDGSYYRYYYLENIMSNAAEPGLRGKSYQVIDRGLPTDFTQKVKIRLAWFEKERMLAAYVNDVEVFETTTPNPKPLGACVEAGGANLGSKVEAVFTDIRVKRDGLIKAYGDNDRYAAESYNGMTALKEPGQVRIFGTTNLPPGTDWDTAMRDTGHASSGYMWLR